MSLRYFALPALAGNFGLTKCAVKMCTTIYAINSGQL